MALSAGHYKGRVGSELYETGRGVGSLQTWATYGRANAVQRAQLNGLGGRGLSGTVISLDFILNNPELLFAGQDCIQAISSLLSQDAGAGGSLEVSSEGIEGGLSWDAIRQELSAGGAGKECFDLLKAVVAAAKAEASEPEPEPEPEPELIQHVDPASIIIPDLRSDAEKAVDAGMQPAREQKRQRRRRRQQKMRFRVTSSKEEAFNWLWVAAALGAGAAAAYVVRR